MTVTTASVEAEFEAYSITSGLQEYQLLLVLEKYAVRPQYSLVNCTIIIESIN